MELKYLIFENQPTKYEQLKKVIEEETEFKKAVIKGDVPNAIEELWDDMQAKLGCLDIMGVPIEQVSAGILSLYTKLENRGWEFKDGEKENRP
ncbi:MAG: hypothetical protein ACRDD7_16375 [Peptostreptococcaceae bacterium]